MREPIKLVRNLSDKPEDFDKSHSSNKEDIVKLLEIVTEKTQSTENKEGTVELLEALSQRAKFCETEEHPIDTEKNSCIFENSCYTAKYKNSPCPCELYRI